MWADAKPDGRPAKCTWRLLLNAVDQIAKITKPRRETSWNLLGCPQLAQPISAVSKPKFIILWGDVEEVLLFNKFFPIVDICLSCEDRAWENCAIVRRWLILASCIFSEPHAAFSDPHSKCHIMCGSVVDIQSETAENRREKKKEEERNHSCKI